MRAPSVPRRIPALVAALLLMPGAFPAVSQSSTAPVAAQAVASGIAAVVPADAVAYIAVDTDAASPQGRQAAALLERAGLPASLDAFAEVINGAMGETTSEDDLLDVDDVTPVLGGTIGSVVGEEAISALSGLSTEERVTSDGVDEEGNAVTPGSTAAAGTPEPSEPTGIAVVVEAGRPERAWDEARRLLADQARTTDQDVVTVVHEGVDILSLANVALARLNDLLLIGGSARDLEPLIETAAGDRDRLVDTDDYQRTRAELPDRGLVFAYADANRYRDALEPDFAAALEALSPILAEQARAGTMSGAVLWADDPGFRMDAVTMAAAGETLPEVPDNFDPTLDERVAGDSFFFGSGSDLGPTGVLDPLALGFVQLLSSELIANTPLGGISGYLYGDDFEEQLTSLESELGFDIRADLFGHMVGEYAMAASFKSTRAPLGLSAILISGVDDADSVEDALTGIDGLIDNRDFGAATISRRLAGDGEMHVVDFEVDGESVIRLTNLGVALEYGVVDGTILVGMDGGIESYLDGPDNQLAENRRFQRVMATLPAEHNTVVYVDIGQLTPLIQLLAAAGRQSAGVYDGSGRFDFDPAFGTYASQADAQEVYEDDPFANRALNLDHDAEACEDYPFGDVTPTPAASPTPDPFLDFVTADYSAIESFAQVTVERDDVIGSSAILYIAGE